MTGDTEPTRRGVLAAIAGVVLATVGTTGATAAGTGTDSRGSVDTRASVRSGLYLGTVDRIVDGEHVVVLLESGGRVVDQVVVGRERVPDASEGDSAAVWLSGGSVAGVWTW